MVRISVKAVMRNYVLIRMTISSKNNLVYYILYHNSMTHTWYWLCTSYRLHDMGLAQYYFQFWLKRL